MFKKGDLYLFDDNYRWATATGMATETETAMEKIWISNWKPFDNGLAVLVEIITRSEDIRDGDIYKMLFNSKNGVRYVYDYQLKNAKLITKHNSNT